MIRFRDLGCLAAFGWLMVSCTQPLPDAASLDRYEEHARVMYKDRLTELEQRRANGQIDATSYNAEKKSLDDQIAAKAVDLAWTRHNMYESRLESLGIPTPDHPQEIQVPEAGTLPTGGNFRRFNDNEFGSTGADSRDAMRRAVMGTMPGSNMRRN